MDTHDLQLELIDLAVDDSGPLNPRGRIGDTTDLQESMRIAGQDRPIEVYAVGDRFIVIDGHRRITAARALGWKTIRAVIKETVEQIDPVAALVHMLASNVRENFKPSQLGRAIQKLALDKRWGLERSAKLCGLEIDRAQLLVDLVSAPETVQRRVDAGEMSLSAWKVLRDKPPATQEKAANLPKPTVAAVRQSMRETKSAGVLAGMLDQMNAEHTLVAQFNEAKSRLMAEWFALSSSEQARVTTLIEGLYSFTHPVEEAAYAEAV